MEKSPNNPADLICLPNSAELERYLSEPGHPVLCIDKSDVDVLNPTELQTPVTWGISHSADETSFQLEIEDRLKTYGRDHYTILSGPVLQKSIDALCVITEKSDAYQRANAVAFSGIANQLHLRNRDDDIAVNVANWITANAKKIFDSESRALAYAYFGTGQAEIFEQAMKDILSQQSTLNEFLKLHMARAFIEVAGPDSNEEQGPRRDIAALSRLI